MSGLYFCSCECFELWYVGDDTGVRVCMCGHPDIEHVDNTKTCLGEVLIVPGGTRDGR